jgi:hypothetical protein
LRNHSGWLVTSIQSEHIPESSQIYRNTTVQSTIQQAHFLSLEFKIFIEELLSENPSANLRRAQGFLREARALKAKVSFNIFIESVKKSIEEMKMFNQIRVHIFKLKLPRCKRRGLMGTAGLYSFGKRSICAGARPLSA